MASFTWIGGPLGNPLSYSPQPPDPEPPILPGPNDSVTFPGAGGGLLVGAIGLRFADFTGDVSTPD
jgi:hypothetical protein